MQLDVTESSEPAWKCVKTVGNRNNPALWFPNFLPLKVKTTPLLNESQRQGKNVEEEGEKNKNGMEKKKTPNNLLT